jgi:hypothetical protein
MSQSTTVAAPSGAVHDAVREFVVYIEKCLTTRRLYAVHMAPYREAGEKLLEKCAAAVGEQGLTLRVGPNDLFVGKTSLINKPKREDAFFFPLYRDGLRELSFAPGTTAEELEGLLSTFEAEEKRALGPTDDTVTYLWRRDLHSITYRAIDGIGDKEGEEGVEAAGEDMSALIADLAAKIRNPAPPETGQTYAFALDADVSVAATDLHYEATTVRRTFDENPTVLSLTGEEAAALRAEVEEDREAHLLERWVSILFSILGSPLGAVPAATLTPIFQKLLEGYWTAGDHSRMGALLERLAVAAGAAPSPESRAAARGVIAQFATADRMRAGVELLKQGTLPLEEAARLWRGAGPDASLALMELWAGMPEGPVRTRLGAALKQRVATDPELVRAALASSEVRRVRAGLALMDEKTDTLYTQELLALAEHADEGIRQKGLSFAGRIGGPLALEMLWKAMEGDPAKSVRLLAFRLMGTSPIPDLPERLRALIASPGFAERPVWEREKFVRLLGTVAAETSMPLFESWIPTKKWLWQPKDHEAAELALRGLSACGKAGLDRVRALAAAGGKVGEIAKKVLEGGSR